MNKKLLEKTKMDNVRVLLAVFKQKYKEISNAIQPYDLLLYLRGTGKSKMSPEALIDAIGYIRKHDLLRPGFILGRKNIGFWFSTDAKEIRLFAYQQSLGTSDQSESVKSLQQRLPKILSEETHNTLF